MISDPNDIFYLPNDHPKWKAIDKIRREIEVDTDQKIYDGVEEYTEQLSASMAAIKKT